VLIVPTKGSEPDRVRLLVVTKDVWSLRINWEPTFYNDPEDGKLKVRSLVLQPSEENLVGRHKILNATVALTPLNYSVGLGFRDPRIAGSRLATSMAANVVINCNTNQAEGSTGGFLYGKPLYSTRTKWGWGAGMTWSDGYVRPRGAVGQSLCNGQRPLAVAIPTVPADPDSPTVPIPYEFHQSVLRGEVSVTRSFGIRFKNDITFGLEANRRVYRGPPELATASPVVQGQFAELMPVSDTRIGPFVQLHAFENRYLRTIDLETLGLQEDYSLGHDVWLKAYPAAQAVGSSRDLIGVGTGLAYTLPLGSGFVRPYVTSGIEVSHAGQSDAQVSVGGRFVSPLLPFGRFIADGFVLDRYRNYLNPLVSLGGTDRLRGYRPQAFVGPNAAVANLEFRSRPIQILTVQTGIAVFYDVGDTGFSMAQIQPRHGIGGGLRLAFPQIQRSVFRIDFGVPLNPNDPAAGANVVARFEQAFDVPVIVSPGLVQ
jgi:hypothetical protein